MAKVILFCRNKYQGGVQLEVVGLIERVFI